jgi:hypothetical protein
MRKSQEEFERSDEEKFIRALKVVKAERQVRHLRS